MGVELSGDVAFGVEVAGRGIANRLDQFSFTSKEFCEAGKIPKKARPGMTNCHVVVPKNMTAAIGTQYFKHVVMT